MGKFFEFIIRKMNNINEENKIQKAKAKKRHKDFIAKIEEQHRDMDKNKFDINK